MIQHASEIYLILFALQLNGKPKRKTEVETEDTEGFLEVYCKVQLAA
jgi:hypothetical protein